MAANQNPLFTGIPRFWFNNLDGDGGAAGALKTANAATDGSGTLLTVGTAGTNGSFLAVARFSAAGSNAGSVARIFINDGAGSGTAHTCLCRELTTVSTSASSASALPIFEILLGFAIPPGYKVMATIGTSVSAGFFVSVIAGDY